MYKWVCGDLRTGKIYREIDVTGTWSTTFDSADSLSLNFPVYAFRPAGPGGYGSGIYSAGKYGDGEGSPARLVWPDVLAETAPCKSFLAVAWVNADGSENWLAGGPIWTQKLTRSTGMVTIGAAGLESYFDHRMVLPVLAAGQSPAAVKSYWQARQLGLIAKRLVQQSRTWVGGDLPIAFPSDATLGGEAVTHERTYPGYELGRIGQRLRQLADVEGGPEIQFAPRRVDAQHLDWEMRIGTTATGMLLTQTGPAHIIDDTVPESMIVDVDRAIDGSGIATDVYAGGQGQGEGRPIARATSDFLLDRGYPRLEIEKASTDNVSTMSTLQTHADGLRDRRFRPTEQYKITVDAQSWWTRSKGARSGDWLTVNNRGHLDFEEGPNELRVLAMSANDDATVDLSCVPKREVA